MKTTLDLPDALVHEIERRAKHKGQELAETVAELLEKGLAASPEAVNVFPRPTIGTNPQTGLACLEGGQPAAPEEEMTPDRIAEVLLEQEATWHREATRG
jgi:hypothetical protein